MAVKEYYDHPWHPRPYPHPGKTCSGWCVNAETFVPQRAMQSRCPSTHRHHNEITMTDHGVQCKYLLMHEGQHCGYAGPSTGDIFWS